MNYFYCEGECKNFWKENKPIEISSCKKCGLKTFRKKFSSFYCNNCKKYWTKNKYTKTSKCYECKKIIFKRGYYNFYCKNCKRSFRLYIKDSANGSLCWTCESFIPIKKEKFNIQTK